MGFIDILWSPSIDLELVRFYEAPTIQPLEDVLPALKEVDAFLRWSKQYFENKTFDVLLYKLGQTESIQRIVGIDAVTGQLIVSTF